MKTLAELLSEVPAFVGLTEGHRELIGGCGRNVILPRGDYVFREGDPANAFYAIRRGDVALELGAPATLVIETLHAGDVLGWSWLFPPYRVRYDARVTDDVHAIAFDGACLREKCDADHDLGYELMRRFAQIITARLQSTRLRLLDVYGPPAAVR
ncbi:MAG TPA: cyclic nucleotide-binding domain-containing protein [Solirubrobacterales bacterium]|jgi:CRP-like cAMP-binding protein